MTSDGDSERTVAVPVFTLGQLRQTGLLWLINRVVLHPRGYAMGLQYDNPTGEGEPVGWEIVYAGDGEQFMYGGTDFDENEKFCAVEELLQQVRSRGRAPALPIPDEPTGRVADAE